MAQRYSDPISHARMADGRCPECGNRPEVHGAGGAFWNCSLREDGVRDRIEQYRADQTPEA